MFEAKRVGIIGAGPAGLTAAYLLAKEGIPVSVFEADPRQVGGISRTVKYKGFCFDIGGHRFFSKSRAVEDLWKELLPHDMRLCRRSSRIYYRGKFFHYPLKASDALHKLGLVESLRCCASYLWAKLLCFRTPDNTFEDWVSRRFGRRLFKIFFKTYTEKVWGMSCKDISSDWAESRIKALSLRTAVLHALRPRFRRSGREVIRTLLDTFQYPRLGPGMMWEAAADAIRNLGGRVHLGHSVRGLTFCRETGDWRIHYSLPDGTSGEFPCTDVISSAPMSELVPAICPRPAPEVLKAATGLKYRDFFIVALILRERNRFDDQWIYIHDPQVRVGRIQNFKAWSTEMIPDPALTCYGMEYFCFDRDGLWSLDDSELIDIAKNELIALGLAEREDILDGCVVRQKKAYPVYDADYASLVNRIRDALKESYPGLHPVGRNGMHKYNNQDHAMLTAMLTVKNILAGVEQHDVWGACPDRKYQEEGIAGEGAPKAHLQCEDSVEIGTRLVPVPAH